MEIKKKVILREVAGVTMLIPVGETAGEYNGVFTLTPTAALIFQCISDGKDIAEIVDAVCDSFEVEKSEAEADVAEFIDVLKQYGIV